MSITDQHKLREIQDATEKELSEAQGQFRLTMNDIEQERKGVLAEARRALEQHAIEKIGQDIHGDGKQ